MDACGLFPRGRRAVVLFSSLGGFFSSGGGIVFICGGSVASDCSCEVGDFVFAAGACVCGAGAFNYELFGRGGGFFRRKGRIFVLYSADVGAVLCGRESVTRCVVRRVPSVRGANRQMLCPQFTVVSRVSFGNLMHEVASADKFGPKRVRKVLGRTTLRVTGLVTGKYSIGLSKVKAFAPTLALHRKGRERRVNRANGRHGTRDVVIKNMGFQMSEDVVEGVGREYCLRETG